MGATFILRDALPPPMRVEATVEADAPLSEVWAWWTDYGGKGDTVRLDHGGLTTERHILDASRTRVVIEEEAPLPLVRKATRATRTVEIDESTHTLVERGEEPVPFESRWRFEPVDGQPRTRIVRTMEVHNKAAEWLSAVAEPVARKMMERDLRHHVRQLEGERKGK